VLPELAGASGTPYLVMNTAGRAYAYGIFKIRTNLFNVDGLH
jgi:hypothetical protein